MTTRPRVPFNDLQRHWSPFTARLEHVAQRVIRSGRFLLGGETDAFEAAFADFSGTSACVGVGNGTDALEIALRAAGCERDDEVIIAPNAGMYATTACLAIGTVPVFADVDPASLLLAPDSVSATVSERTRAIVVTHLYGNVADVDTFRTALPAGVAIVEDCAQAHGASFDGRPAGSLGDVAAFSFYPTKNLGALGDAGAVVTSDPDLARRARALRQYGWERRYVATVAGGRNTRIDEIQAAILREFLPDVGVWNDRRTAIRSRYVDALGEQITFVTAPSRSHPATHLCVARSPKRDDVIAALATAGVTCEVHYPVPDHRQPAVECRPFRAGAVAEAERACREVFSLPCFPSLTDEEVDHVIDAMKQVV